jgi:hypothetical protein
MENSMNLTRKSLSGLVAFGAVLAMPLAFAQTSPTTQADPAQTTQPTTTQNAEPATQPAGAAQPKQVTWADLDTDKDGNLSKQEVTPVPSLTQVFDQADSDKDGKLTADEYKAFAAKSAGASGQSGG